MKIPVTQELIDAVKHEDDSAFGHFPCLTERAIRAVTGYGVDVFNGRVTPWNDNLHAGAIDETGSAYQYAYDAHRWDDIQPGTFEYTPG